MLFHSTVYWIYFVADALGFQSHRGDMQVEHYGIEGDETRGACLPNQTIGQTYHRHNQALRSIHSYRQNCSADNKSLYNAFILCRQQTVWQWRQDSGCFFTWCGVNLHINATFICRLGQLNKWVWVQIHSSISINYKICFLTTNLHSSCLPTSL